MAGTTFTITVGATPYAFGDLKLRGTRNGLLIDTGNPQYEYRRRHIPGTDGNCVVEMGGVGKSIVATGLYIGAWPTIAATYESDKAAMSGVVCTITDDAGNSNTRCRLRDARRTGPPKGFNLAGVASSYFIATFTFDKDS